MIHRPFQVCLSLSLALLTGFSGPLSAMAAIDWYTLKANGQVIGKVRIESYPARESQSGMVTEVSNINHFTRHGSPFELNATSRFVENTANGNALSFTYRYELGEQRLLEAEGYLNNGVLDLRTMAESGTQSGYADLSTEPFLFPGGIGIQKAYQSHYGDTQGQQFHYQTLHLGVQPQVVHTEVTALQPEKLALATGEFKAVRKFELHNPGAQPGQADTIYEWRDAGGKLYKSQSIGRNGMEMVYASQREIREVDQNTLDLVNASAVPSNVIPQPRITTDAIYKIAPLGSRNIDLKSLFPESLNQQKTPPAQASGEEGSIWLKVKTAEPANSLATFPVEYDRAYLQATPYMQVSDTQLERLALSITKDDNRSYYAARKLQQWVYRNIANKDLALGFASARETFDRRQGDCTEHAVLLASLLRSVGIPSRVAVGLIYIPDSESDLGRFVFHMWTEAYVGNRFEGDWVAFDATNPEFLPDATHIKLADSPLTDASDLNRLTQQVVEIIGKIRLDVIKAMSSAESTLSVQPGSGDATVNISKLDIHRIDVESLTRNSIQHYRIDLPPASLSMDTVDGLFTHGMEAQAQGRYDEAQQFFVQALHKARRPVELYLLGERLVAIGRYTMAKDAFTQAKTKMEGLSPLIADWNATSLPGKELPAQAQTAFIKALGLQAQSDASENPLACEAFQAVITEGGEHFFPAYRGLGQSCSGEAGVQALVHAAYLNPLDFQSLEALGDAYLAQKHYSKAVKAYRDALAVLKGRSFTHGRSWVSNLQGKIEVAQGAAILAHASRDPQGWLQVGKGLWLQHRNLEARQALQNAVQGAPSLLEANLLEFQMDLAASNWRAIFQEKNRIAGWAASNALASRLIGEYQIRTRQYGQAELSLQRAIALNPANEDVYDLLSQVYTRLATQASWQKKPQSAQSYAKKADIILKRGTLAIRNPEARNRLALKLGVRYLAAENFVAAGQLADSVLDSEPLNGRAYWLKGKSLFYAGQNEAAHEALKNAFVLLPNDPDTLLTQGLLAEEQGRETLALDFYQRAYKADSGHGEAAQALRRLMDKLQVAGKRPPAFTPLSDDEHDYLVQFCYFKQQVEAVIVKSQIETILLQSDAKPTPPKASGSAPNPPSRGATPELQNPTAPQTGQPIAPSPPKATNSKTAQPALSLASIQKLKQGRALLEEAAHKLGNQYAQLQAMQVPPRFQRLHFLAAEHFRQAYALVVQQTKSTGIYNATEAAKTKKSLQVFEANAKQSLAVAQRALQQTFANLPPTEAERIYAESGLNQSQL